jgi:hypothetical protein
MRFKRRRFEGRENRVRKNGDAFVLVGSIWVIVGLRPTIPSSIVSQTFISTNNQTVYYPTKKTFLTFAFD